MPVELHERLSEFSYGYGVTREVEGLLKQSGLVATPFLPSLLHEARLGFDVAFKRRGAPLLLQFKLGQALRRFVPGPRPLLKQPFWRYRIDTAERDGQFELLLKAEQDGADVLYLAPRFHDWATYLEAFELRRILRNSLIVRPSKIRKTLQDNLVSDGPHKVVYDEQRAYLCSMPLALEAEPVDHLADKLRSHIERLGMPIGQLLLAVFQGFSNRAAVRQPLRPDDDADHEGILHELPSDEDRDQQRIDRLVRLQSNGRSYEQAIALAVGAEAWSAGAQLLFVTET